MTNAKFSTTSIDILPTYNAMLALLHLPTSNFVSRYILSDVNGVDSKSPVDNDKESKHLQERSTLQM